MIMGIGDQMFPLSVSANGRYLQTAGGNPYFFLGNATWSMEVQLSNAEIAMVLDKLKENGFTAIQFEACEHFFSSQSPAYQNVDGQNPFSTMSPTDFSVLNNTYWNRIDFVVNQALCRGMACLFYPAYLGFGGGSEGWMSEVTADSAAHLQTYGTNLANRFTQKNIIWVMGGDYAGTQTERDKQYNIMTGIRTVRTSDLMTGHAAPGNSGFSAWDTYNNFNVNSAYPGGGNSGTTYSLVKTEYDRATVRPVIMIEAGYEQENSMTLSDLRRQSYTAFLSGACGVNFGNNPTWHFGCAVPPAPFSYTGTWWSNMSGTSGSFIGTFQQRYVTQLFRDSGYKWWLLVPKDDTSLITTALGSGTSRIVGALATGGVVGSTNDLAMIWTPSVDFTVQMTNFSQSSVRGRWYNPTDGTFTTASGSPYANSGTHAFTNIGERILVLD